LALGATAASIFSFMHLRAEYYYSRAVNGEYVTQNIREKIDWARNDFVQAIRLYPFDYRYYYWLGVLEMRSGNGPEALRATLEALTLNPYHINTLNNLGVVYTYLGNLPRAIQAFETALRIWPYYINVQNNLGQIYEKTGAREKAIEAFQNTLRIDPKNKLASEQLADLLDQK
jgi:tetratricopeptide (TPR) repeat protein